MPKLTADKKWKRFNEKLEKLMRKNDIFGLGTIYYEMANFLKQEGKDNSQMRKHGYQMKLHIQTDQINDYQRSGAVKHIQIMATPSSCEICMQQNGKIFTIEESLAKSPLPVENCGHEYGCRCTYAPKID